MRRALDHRDACFLVRGNDLMPVSETDAHVVAVDEASGGPVRMTRGFWRRVCAGELGARRRLHWALYGSRR